MSQSSPQKTSPALVLMLFIAVFSGLMGYVIGHELWYSLSGKTTEAKITRHSVESRSAGKYRGSHSVVVIDYSFTEASGRQRTERDEVSGSSVGETVAVDYIPGVGGLSRVQNDQKNQPGGLILVVGMFLPLFFGSWWFLFRPRWGGLVINMGGFILSVMLIGHFFITLLWNGALAHPWIGILTAPVPLISGAMGLGGLWFSSRELWSSSRPRSQEPDLRTDPEAPKFSADSLICELGTGVGKPRAVIVDHAAGMIHFQNCHWPHGFWVIRSQAWLSCPLNDVLRTRHKTTKIQNESVESFVMETPTGSATVHSNLMSNYEALRQYFASNVTDFGARKRTYALRQIALRLRFQFVSQGHDKFHHSLEGFHLASVGMHQRLFNLMHGKMDGTDVAVFDYAYQLGKQQVHQTVIWLQRRGTKRTDFVLRPEVHWLGRLESFFVEYQDINFDSHPTFSREYLLRGTDEAAIRELFTDNVLTFYERNLGLSTEGSGNKLLYYYGGGSFEPDEIQSFLNEALQLLSVLEPATAS